MVIGRIIVVQLDANAMQPGARVVPGEWHTVSSAAWCQLDPPMRGFSARAAGPRLSGSSSASPSLGLENLLRRWPRCSHSQAPSPERHRLCNYLSSCAKVAGVDDVEIVHYDPKAVDDIPKGFFPFRDTPFFVSADKARDLLGFEPKHSIVDDCGWYFEQNYKAQGGMDKEVPALRCLRHRLTTCVSTRAFLPLHLHF